MPFHIKKAENPWLNSDKELIAYQLLADGIRGAYGNPYEQRHLTESHEMRPCGT